MIKMHSLPSQPGVLWLELSGESVPIFDGTAYPGGGPLTVERVAQAIQSLNDRVEMQTADWASGLRKPENRA